MFYVIPLNAKSTPAFNIFNMPVAISGTNVLHTKSYGRSATAAGISKLVGHRRRAL